MNQPEQHNLNGWLQELVDLTTPEQCNDLFETLLVNRNQAAFKSRVQRIMALAKHVRSYGVEDDEWQMAVREQDDIDSTEAVAAYVCEIAPAFERSQRMTEIIDIIAITHFRAKLWLAVLQSNDAIDSSAAIAAAHDLQPTRLGEQPYEHVRFQAKTDTGGGEIRRAA